MTMNTNQNIDLEYLPVINYNESQINEPLIAEMY